MGYALEPPQQEVNKSHKNEILAVAITTIVVIGVFLIWYFFVRSHTIQEDVGTAQVAEEQFAETEAEEPQVEVFPNLQPVIDGWVSTHTGTYSILITDRSGKLLAQNNPNQQFFYASMYKLFVAYEAYRNVDNGTYNAGEVLLGGKTIGQCLDAMIRSSDSPCGEAMLAKLGAENLNTKMQEYGISSTSFTGLQGTAGDVAIILRNIYGGIGLSAASRAAYLDSMKTQERVYRLGLPSGFTNSVVYNKVGWNENYEWHDGSIVELPDGRVVIVSVFSYGAGYSNMSDLGRTIEQALE